MEGSHSYNAAFTRESALHSAGARFSSMVLPTFFLHKKHQQLPPILLRVILMSAFRGVKSGADVVEGYALG